eukprot:TRINITY_DN242_c0_g1_i1.p1 TRINITY_DN242_c0_g1~~TRINITY_DN242_c0_g1_i1.p1  ORF type:complete len:390 (+),score=64.39 TRINITY_DN242_c0_g1_i1:47-1216(+)
MAAATPLRLHGLSQSLVGMRKAALHEQARSFRTLRYPALGAKMEAYRGEAWEQNCVDINPMERGTANDQGLEHFLCSRAMDRLPPDQMTMPLPSPPLDMSKWARFYYDFKFCHPMPVSQWVEEPGWTLTSRKDPYLEAFHGLHFNVNTHWRPFRPGFETANETHRHARLASRRNLMAGKAKLIKGASHVPAADKVLTWVQEMAAGKPIVEVQAGLGYWSKQLQNMDIPVAATYEEWGELRHRRGHEDHCTVLQRSGEVEFANGDHDDHAVLTVSSERPLEELDSWKGDTLIHIGQGALGGDIDVGRYLISRNEGWELVSTMRTLFWPLTFHHAYCFKKLNKEDREKLRERRLDISKTSSDSSEPIRRNKTYPCASNLGGQDQEGPDTKN